MDAQLTMRAADHDRQQVVDRLRSAVADGRLTVDEYVDRMGRAYQSVTYGDLAPLYADLPADPRRGWPGWLGRTEPAPGGRPPGRPMTAGRAGLAGLPAVLKVLWTIWLTAVSVNLMVWMLVSVTSGHLAYPWPLWVAGPWGAVLFAQSVSARHLRRGRTVQRGMPVATQRMIKPARRATPPPLVAPGPGGPPAAPRGWPADTAFWLSAVLYPWAEDKFYSRADAWPPRRRDHGWHDRT